MRSGRAVNDFLNAWVKALPLWRLMTPQLTDDSMRKREEPWIQWHNCKAPPRPSHAAWAVQNFFSGSSGSLNGEEITFVFIEPLIKVSGNFLYLISPQFISSTWHSANFTRNSGNFLRILFLCIMTDSSWNFLSKVFWLRFDQSDGLAAKWREASWRRRGRCDSRSFLRICGRTLQPIKTHSKPRL